MNAGIDAGDTAADRPGETGIDERFERLARSTGAEFRRSASAAGLAAIADLARRRRRQQQLGVTAVVAVALLGAVWALPGGSSTDPSSPTTGSTVAPSTTTPPTTIPLSLAVEGEIARQRFTGDTVEIRRMLPDGSDGGRLLELLPVTGALSHLDWSPSGDRVVVTVGVVDGPDDLWIAAPDGSEATQAVDCATPCLGVDEAAWSPDGGTIAFQRQVGSESAFTSTLELLDVATGETRVVLTADPNTAILAPRWSPDGRRLVVEWLQLAGPQPDAEPTGDIIGIVDLDAPVPAIVPLTSADRFGSNPDWSPDGSTLVFAARVPGESTLQDLYLMAPDGTDQRRLTTTADDGDMAVQPTFTPDGTAVVFSFHPGGSNRGVVRIVRLSGGAPFTPGGGEDVDGDVPRMRPTG